jgi:predicted transcriptional regulator
MNTEIIVALIITIVFCVLKMAEHKILDEQSFALKNFVRDAAIVAAAAFTGLFGSKYALPFLTKFVNTITDAKVTEVAGAPHVFTGEPEF